MAQKGRCECGAVTFEVRGARASVTKCHCSQRPGIGALAGSLDTPTGLHTGKHIFVADKGDYYNIADDEPQIEKY